MSNLARSSLKTEIDLINKRSLARALRAFRCLPLNYAFYKEVQIRGLNAEEVFLNENLYRIIQKKWFRNAPSVESAFRWLIKIGVLRREVDGQGLTSKIRLTPLGRQLLDQKPSMPSKKASHFDSIMNCFARLWAHIK